MKKEVRQLRQRALNSLALSAEHFNRPWDRGRTEAVLIFLGHSLEMLLKAAIRHRRGKLRKARERQTIGFSACVRKGLSETGLKFLTEEQALALQAVNGLRDAAQHYLIDVSDRLLCVYALAGVTLFRDIHNEVFPGRHAPGLPPRSTPAITPDSTDLRALIDKEVEEVIGLLAPGTRKMMDAVTRLRSLAVLENAANGDSSQPSRRELEKICRRLAGGEAWQSALPGAASVGMNAEFDGPYPVLRLTRISATPYQLF